MKEYLKINIAVFLYKFMIVATPLHLYSVY